MPVPPQPWPSWLPGLFALLLLATPALTQEPPYLVTYSDVLEEPGNLEIASQSLYSAPKDANAFQSQTFELEYGLTAWWTAEAYLQGQVTSRDSTVFTGFRFENRFRPLPRTHRVNPVFYIEYEDISRADKSFLEVTGNHVIQDGQISNARLRRDVERAAEGKLILSSYFKGVNVSGNFIAEKNLSNEPWEFGYALAGSRPLANEAHPRPCLFCRQYLSAGGELFGGLGTRYTFGTAGTSQYAGPTLAFTGLHNISLLVGPEFGLNRNSGHVLWRLKAAYEIDQFRDLFRKSR